jgi:hypothetical protein
MIEQRRNARGGKGICLDDVGAGLDVGVVDILDSLRLSQDQKVVVALLMIGAADEAVAAEVVFLKSETLDLHAHRPVEDKDSLTRGGLELGKDFGAVRLGGDRPEELID